MLISEQGLCRAIKQIHKTGYDILMDENELVISSERFLAVMDRRDIPRKVLGLMAEHMGCLPDGVCCLTVKKGQENQDKLWDVANEACKSLRHVEHLKETLLKATKTSLYQLTASFEKMPGIRSTEFSKVPRRRSYFMKWSAGEEFCQAYFTICLGDALLSVEKRDWSRNRTYRKVYHISVHELRDRGMVEECAPRRRAATA